MTTTTPHPTTATHRSRRRGRSRRAQLAGALVLAEVRRLNAGAVGFGGMVGTYDLASYEARATPLAAETLDILDAHGVDLDAGDIPAAVGGLAVAAAGAIETGHAQRTGPAWWLETSTPISAIEARLHELDVDTNKAGPRAALDHLAGALAGAVLTTGSGNDPTPAATAAPEGPAADAEGLLAADITAERAQTSRMDTKASATAAVLLGAVGAVLATGVLTGRSEPATILGWIALGAGLAVAVALGAAIWPRVAAAPPADAADLAERAQALAADPGERMDLAAAELAELRRINRAKTRWIRAAMLGLALAVAVGAAAAGVEALT